MKSCSCGAYYTPKPSTPNQQQCDSCLTLKQCSCGVKFNHPTRDHCGKCSGWVCGQCGRGKTPEQVTCNRPQCKRTYTLRLNRQSDGRVTNIIRKRGTMK